MINSITDVEEGWEELKGILMEGGYGEIHSKNQK